jgi:hypothetical protein
MVFRKIDVSPPEGGQPEEYLGRKGNGAEIPGTLLERAAIEKSRMVYGGGPRTSTLTHFALHHNNCI